MNKLMAVSWFYGHFPILQRPAFGLRPVTLCPVAIFNISLTSELPITLDTFYSLYGPFLGYVSNKLWMESIFPANTR